MKTLLLLLCSMFAVSAYAQNTPAPCDPANLQATDVKYGCYNTPDCVTGFMCFYIRVLTDVFYGTTCDEQPQYLCSSPNDPPGVASVKCPARQELPRRGVVFYRNPVLAFTIDLRQPIVFRQVRQVQVKDRFWWKKVKV